MAFVNPRTSGFTVKGVHSLSSAIKWCKSIECKSFDFCRQTCSKETAKMMTDMIDNWYLSNNLSSTTRMALDNKKCPFEAAVSMVRQTLNFTLGLNIIEDERGQIKFVILPTDNNILEFVFSLDEVVPVTRTNGSWHQIKNDISDFGYRGITYQVVSEQQIITTSYSPKTIMEYIPSIDCRIDSLENYVGVYSEETMGKFPEITMELIMQVMQD